jgi:hypothetical protein
MELSIESHHTVHAVYGIMENALRILDRLPIEDKAAIRNYLDNRQLATIQMVYGTVLALQQMSCTR